MDDYIKRENAINVFCWDEDLYVRCGIATKNIKDIPSADVRENVKGEWIDITMWHDEYFGNKCQAPAQKCSNCGEWSVGINKKFCPNCGAQMKK